MPTNIQPRQETIPPEIIEGFRSVGVGDIGHVALWGFIDPAIRPVWRDIRLVGPAVTVWMPTMGAALTRQAILTAKPGDVIIIDRGGEDRVACWGGFVTLLAKAAGVAGLIVDGAVTDTMEISDLDWPVYARNPSGLLGRSQGDEGAINTTVSCGGVAVSPGDLVVADDDGVVIIRPEQAASLLAECQERFGRTPNIREWLQAGKSIGDYPGVTEFLQQQS